MSKTNDRHVDDHLIDGGEGSGDQELLADFRILINEVAQRVVVEAVRPELSGAVRDLRGSADSARDSLKRSAGQLEQLARSTRDERNAFKEGFLNAPQRGTPRPANRAGRVGDENRGGDRVRRRSDLRTVVRGRSR